jgi:Arc/MetJ-type ribon-helix-helix transcriptional regulator
MAIVNFSVPQTLEKQIHTIVKKRGFASKAEFFRCAAVHYLKMMNDPWPAIDPESLDNAIVQARKEYKKGNFVSYSDAGSLLKALKK